MDFSSLLSRIQNKLHFSVEGPLFNAGALLVFSALGLVMLLGQWAMVRFGETGQTQFFVDARNVWKPLAEDVLRNDAPLYGPDQWDNKPPLWQYINIAVAAVGPYYLLFYALVGLSHGVAAYLLYIFVRSYNAQVALVSSILFLGAVPAVFAARINPRPFAEILLLIAIIYSKRSGSLSGGALAAATNLSQFSIFLAPVVIWNGIRDQSLRAQAKWLTKFSLVGLSIGVISFGSVLIIWGEKAVRYAIQYSILSIGSYSSSSSVVATPITTLGGHIAHATQIYYIVLPALFGIGIFLTEERSWTSLPGVCLLSAGALFLPLLVRPGGIYLYSPLPFMSVFAAMGLQHILSGYKYLR